MLAALVTGSLLGMQQVSADSVLAVTVPSDYANSQLGTITGSKVTTRVNATANRAVLSDLNRDPAAYPTYNNGEAGFLLRQYTYSTTDIKGSSVYTIDENGNLKLVATGTTSNVPNAHASSGDGKFIYATGYDLGKVGVYTVDSKGNLVELNQDNPKDPSVVKNGTSLLNDIKTYAPKSAGGFNDKTAVHGEGILAIGDNLYVLASVNLDGSYASYLDGYLMHYKVDDKGKLQFKSYDRIGKNTDSGRINRYNDYLFVSAIGGMQNYGFPNNSESSHATISAVPVYSDGSLSFNTGNEEYLDGSHTEVVIPDNVKYVDKDKDANGIGGTDFHDMAVMPDGTAYILGYVLYGTGEGFNGHVYQTTVSNLLSKNPEAWTEIKSGESSGWFGKLYADYYTKRLWLEYGNDLEVYMDGSSTPDYKWAAKDFSTNENYYQFNSVAVLGSDKVTGNTASLYKSKPMGMGTYTADSADTSANEDAASHKATYSNKITGTASDASGDYKGATTDGSTYTFSKGTVIGLGLEKLGDQTTNVLADIDAHAGNNVTINAGNNILQLYALNYIGNPTGIYAGNGKDVDITARKVNVITENYPKGNSITNAVWNDPAKNESSAINIHGDLNISMTGGIGGNGIAIAKTTRWGEASYASTGVSSVTVDGNVKIAGRTYADWGIPLNSENVYSRFNNAGILTSVENSKVNVKGNVDFSVYGNGVTTNAIGSSVTVGGGKIVVPKSMGYGYYTLGAYQGTINMNSDGSTAGTSDVMLDGDIFALSTGTVNVGLTTSSSYLNGIIDNGGTASLWLQNGAQWTNTAQNMRYAKDNEDVGAGEKSHVTYLHGGSSESAAGIINQRSESKLLTIDNYSGYTTALFSHDSSNPATILGGDIVIRKADAGSHISLITDYSDSMSDSAVQDKVLNALAGKLSYSEYVSGIKNLSGTVSIAEGLTASSVLKKSGTIAFNSAGIGTYGANIEPTIPDNQSKASFYTAITGDKATNTEYVYGGVLKDDGIYHFILDSSTVAPDSGAALVTSKDVTVDASDKEFTLTGKETGASVTAGKTASITAGTININGTDTGISNAGTAVLNGTVNINGTNTGISTAGSTVLKGTANIKASNADGTAMEVLDGGSITMDKGTVTGKISVGKGTALFNEANSRVSLGIKGNISTASGGSTTINLNGSNASLSGDIDAAGTVSLNMDNGARWTGTASGDGLNLYLHNSTWISSGTGTVKSLTTKGGVIQGGNLTIDKLSGDATFLYSHSIDKANKKITFGDGTVTVKSADPGSFITMLTDNFGFDTTDSTLTASDIASLKEDTLKQLAQKLWYTASTTGETNLSSNVVIAEGLTASSASLKAGRVEFDANGQGQYTGKSAIILGDIVDMRGKPDIAPEEKKEVAKTYIYGYDKTTGTVNGGKITLPKFSGTTNIRIQLDAADVDLSDRSNVEKAMAGVLEKLDNEGKNTIHITIDITDGLDSKAEVLREYNGSYGDVTGTIGVGKAINPYSITKAVYTQTIIGDKDKDKAYTYNPGGQIETGRNFLLRQTWTEKNDDGIYAGIRPAQSVTLNGYYRNDGEPIRITEDTSALDTGAAYGIYNVKPAVITVENHRAGNMSITLKTSEKQTGSGIYSAVDSGTATLNLGENPGKWYSDGHILSITADRGEGITAGKNSTVNVYYGRLTVNAGSHGLHALDGGVINTYTYGYTGKGAAAYAEKGGQINLKNWTTQQCFAAPYQNLTGDLKTDDTGIINYNLTGAYGTTATSFPTLTTWTGNADGNVNITMDGGSTWNGISLNDKATLSLAKESVWNIPDTASADTALGTLKGSTGKDTSGFIFMGASGKNVTVDKYSGYTTLFYDHDSANPTSITGGTFTVKAADAGSFIRMVTDSEGLNTSSTAGADMNLVSETLNALAGKLYYSAYAGGEKNLTGSVEIAEGLTSTSATLKLGDISFKEENGQGYYKYTPESEKTYDTTITVPLDVRDGKYDEYTTEEKTSNGRNFYFDDNTLIKVDDANAITIGNDALTTAVYLPSGMSVSIGDDGAGSDLDLQASGKGRTVGIYTSSHKNTASFTSGGNMGIDVVSSGTEAAGIELQNGSISRSNGALRISASNTGSGDAYGIYIKKGTFTANSAVTMEKEGSTWGVEADSGKAYGLYADGNSGNTRFDSLSMKVKGTGIYTGYDNDDDYTITVNKGVSITTPDDGSADTMAINMYSGTLNMTGAGDKTILGNMHAANMGTIHLDLNTAGSTFTGTANGEDGGTIDLSLSKGALWENRSVGKKGSGFSGSELASFTGAFSGSTAGVIYQKDTDPLTIDSYSGHAVVVYDHTGDGTASSDYSAGNLIITRAAADSAITLSTDSTGIDTTDTAKTTSALNALAGKLYYSAYASGERNLTGTVQIAEGLTTPGAALKTGKITFADADGKGSYTSTSTGTAKALRRMSLMAKATGTTAAPAVSTSAAAADTDSNANTIRIVVAGDGKDSSTSSGSAVEEAIRKALENSTIVYGSKETAMVRGAKSAMATSMLSWRSHMTDMMTRMGSLRMGADSGLWARTYGGKARYDAHNTDSSESFWGAQIGADRKLGSGWFAGGALDYGKGSASYEMNGRGTPKVHFISLYASKLFDNGAYLDIEGKAGRVENRYHVYNAFGHRLDGDYGSNGYGLSVEYGKRFGSEANYIEPSARISWGHLDSADYNGRSDFDGGKSMHIHQDGMDTLVGRLGISLGRKTERADYYLKAGLFHEFKGDTTSTFSAANEPTTSVDQNFKDTWAELTLGGTWQVGKATYIYADFTRSFGGDYEMQWKANAGIRYRF